ncbi:ERF family protein [Roseibacterium sp. SDUM158017]|uniref:ERF family protein n=1 Tax=Roseicyclus salinarum TaxID=3036773 RepID=UPI002414F859|nr:ERF family protein [Roseibacterium sp. SDUM158017]MDG4650089.1 ERF family protein [Roseibacterium sp. SDUM158017]
MTAQEKIAVKHSSIAAALTAAQMQMGKALKSAKNPHFKTNYADLTSVMDACLPALNANGIAVVQPTTDDENGRYVETVLIHGESGQELRCRVPLIVQKNDMQGYGSAVTYARRYGLMSMAGIAPEDDDGHAAAQAAPKREEPRRDIGPDQAAVEAAVSTLNAATNLDALKGIFTGLARPVQGHPDVIKAKDDRKAALDAQPNADLAHDEIPY